MADEDEDAETIVCANPDCRVAETGRCVEGFELYACQFYGREPDEGEVEAAAADEKEVGESIDLPTAGTLSLAEASRVLRQSDARVIAILGPSDSGKTSLIAGLYDLFQEGAIADVEFARSRTLHAFEHTCHDARAASRRRVPHMNRTPIGEVSFYHLEIGGGAAGERLVLLLGDRAGEEYRAAADDVTVAVSFLEISRADTLTVLVDGERLLDTGARHNLRSDVLMMLQGLHDGDGLRPGSRLALVLTKLDVIKDAKQAERALRDFDTLFSDLQRLFGGVLGEIESFQVAASPRSNLLPRGTGVQDLLTFWLKPTAPMQEAFPKRPHTPTSIRPADAT
jgi:hypothetical protein